MRRHLWCITFIERISYNTWPLSLACSSLSLVQDLHGAFVLAPAPSGSSMVGVQFYYHLLETQGYLVTASRLPKLPIEFYNHLGNNKVLFGNFNTSSSLPTYVP